MSSGMISARNRKQRIYNERKKNGQCVNCGQPRGESKILLCSCCQRRTHEKYKRKCQQIFIYTEFHMRIDQSTKEEEKSYA